MFDISNRRYTGSKTKMLPHIDEVIYKHCKSIKNKKNASFFDVFAGTGVVSEYFLHKSKNSNFTRFYINDFLHSNYAIYSGFFGEEDFDLSKLDSIAFNYNTQQTTDIKSNYYSEHFGDKFFSFNDSKKIGFIRENIDVLQKTNKINAKEFYILLSSLIYSVDRVSNTVGHYDAYRKLLPLKDRFYFELIRPIKSKKEVKIFKDDSNILAKKLCTEKIDVAFIDPPYNSRQYSRFYHLLETLTKNNHPKLYGVAQKPSSENISEYSKSQAKEIFRDLIESLSIMSENLIITYNNTNSANARSNTKISLEEIFKILESKGKVDKFEFLHRPFNAGKTDFNEHKEIIFLCQVYKNI